MVSTSIMSISAILMGSMKSSENANYDIPNTRAEQLISVRSTRMAPFRGIGAGYTKFAAVKGTWEDIINSGNLNLIRDFQLKGDIVKYHMSIENAASYNLDVLKLGLKGWSNFKNEDGQDIKFYPKANQ